MAPKAKATDGWRSAVMGAILIALLVGVVGSTVLALGDRTFAESLRLVWPGVLLGVGASLLMSLLGARHRAAEATLERMDRDAAVDERPR